MVNPFWIGWAQRGSVYIDNLSKWQVETTTLRAGNQSEILTDCPFLSQTICKTNVLIDSDRARSPNLEAYQKMHNVFMKYTIDPISRYLPSHYNRQQL